MTQKQVGLLLLRLGIASLFLWFGFSQLFDSIAWVVWVPEWAVLLFHLPPAILVLANGLLEVTLGSLLAMGLFVRVTALILAAHLAIITFDIGFTAIGVRDFSLTVATLALALLWERYPEEHDV